MKRSLTQKESKPSAGSTKNSISVEEFNKLNIEYKLPASVGDMGMLYDGLTVKAYEADEICADPYIRARIERLRISSSLCLLADVARDDIPRIVGKLVIDVMIELHRAVVHDMKLNLKEMVRKL